MKILDDIIYLLFLIFMIIVLTLMLNSWLSFFVLILTSLVFIIKLIITKEKINSLMLGKNINNINETNEIENLLLSYSNDISKSKLSTKKEEVQENFDVKEENHIEEEIATKEKDEIKEEFIENKENSTNNLKLNDTKDLETVINDNTSVEDNVNKKDEKYSLTDEELKKCIRKLGVGRKASDKAKELARKYGYELKEGETFVSPK